MGAPLGHKPYKGCEKGASFGYLGKPENYYTDELLDSLGKGLVAWIQENKNIFCKYYFATKGISWDMVHNLGKRSPMFKSYLDIAKQIQESKLVTEPYLKTRDGNHARFILARHHKGEWEEKAEDKEQYSDEMKAVADAVMKQVAASQDTHKASLEASNLKDLDNINKSDM